MYVYLRRALKARAHLARIGNDWTPRAFGWESAKTRAAKRFLEMEDEIRSLMMEVELEEVRKRGTAKL